uniref:Uncharacterized protein n=1 Tax=Arundo donax TaxID=35708 RepID=A0A0A8YRQ1_ARUDO
MNLTRHANFMVLHVTTILVMSLGYLFQISHYQALYHLHFLFFTNYALWSSVQTPFQALFLLHWLTAQSCRFLICL